MSKFYLNHPQRKYFVLVNQEDEVLDQAAQNMKDVAAVINRLLQKGYMEIEKDGTIINYLEEDYD